MNTSTRIRRRWTADEDETLRKEAAYQLADGPIKDWNRVAAKLAERTNKDCRKRWSKISEPVKKGSWDSEEDQRLREAVKVLGTRWTQVAQMVGSRQADQCAKRWTHSLDPTLDHSEWKEDEDRRLLAAVAAHGRNWSQIADAEFPGRAKLALKNRYAVLKKKLNLDDSHGLGAHAAAAAAAVAVTNTAAAAATMVAANNVSSLANRRGSIADRMQLSDESEDSDEYVSSESTRPPSRTLFSNFGLPDQHNEFDFNMADFSPLDSHAYLGPQNGFIQPMQLMDKGMNMAIRYPSDNMAGDVSYDDTMMTPRALMSNPFDLTGSYGSVREMNSWAQPPSMLHQDSGISMSDTNMGAPISRYSSGPGMVSLSPASHSPSPVNRASRRTTMILENVQEDTLSQVMNILFQAKAKVSMETDHQDYWPTMPGSG